MGTQPGGRNFMFAGRASRATPSPTPFPTPSPTPDPTPSPTPDPPDLSGTYTVVQGENNRYLDAWLTDSKDYSVVTRGEQNDDTQKWIFTRVGAAIDQTYTIQQKENNRYLDAWLTDSKDYSVVTRGEQNNDSQK